jgi:uncharacterized protein YjbI with pentapeptide repeats
MANPDHLAVLKKGVDAWNEWRKEHPEIRPDLRRAELHKANLAGANLIRVDLTEAGLTLASLRKANLREADLTEAQLAYADFSKARLIRANLSRADLAFVAFSETTLRKTEFWHARFWDTLFADVDLRGAEGLEAVEHDGPSTIGIDTIYRSGGEISELFLRGAGVPDTFITFMKSLAGKAIEFYSCFISYSTKEQEFAERLYADLQANNVRCWFAPHDMAGGKKIHEQIDEAIRLHDKLLLILSPASIRSPWVETEIAKARKREVRDERRGVVSCPAGGF